MAKGYTPGECKVDCDTPINRSAALGTGTKLNEKPKYVENQDKDKGQGVSKLKEKANKSLSDRPTTASAQKGLKDLPSVISKVGKSAVHLQNMYSTMATVSSILSAMSSSGDNEENPAPTSGKKTIIEDALTGALAILVKKWGYDLVIDAFDNALSDGGIDLIDEDYQEIVKNALANIYVSALINGPTNIPLYEYDEVTFIGDAPTPVVTEVPDLYIKEYYSPETDPYPGYIKWNSLDETDFVFTERAIGDKYYTSPNEEVYSIAEEELAEGLDPYMENSDLTAEILNDLLLEQNINIENNMDEATLGSGTGGSNSQQLLQQLLGFLSVATNLQKSAQLPFSVLNSGSIQNTLKKFEKSTAKHKQMSKLLDKSVQVAGAASSLSSALGAAGGLGGISGALGAAGALGSVSGALGSVSGALGSVSSISGSIGSVSGAVGSVTSAASSVGVKLPKVLG
jgi:hypothetical protein